MTPLRQILTYFDNSRAGISLTTLAREMDLSPGQVESMLEFWVRKGKIRPAAVQDCGSCSTNGKCAFVIEMPLSYELVREQGTDSPEGVQPACERVW